VDSHGAAGDGKQVEFSWAPPSQVDSHGAAGDGEQVEFSWAPPSQVDSHGGAAWTGEQVEFWVAHDDWHLPKREIIMLQCKW